MANKAKRRGKWDAVTGLSLAGLAILLAVALFTFRSGDLPSWAWLIYDGSPKGHIFNNLCGVVGAVAAGYLYFFFGAAAWLWIIVLAGYGIAKLTTRDFSLRERAGWSLLFVLSGACLLQLQPWFFADWRHLQFAAKSPGGWLGLYVGRAFGTPLGELGAPIVLGAIYGISLVLAIGFHPVNVMRRGWQRMKNHFTERERRRLAAMEESERIEAEQRKLAKQAEKLERQLKKNPEPAAPPTPPENQPEPEIFDATVPPEKRPSLAEIEQARRKKTETRPNLGSLHLENYELPPLSLLDPINEANRRPADHDELRGIQNTILETLAHFGIEATAGPITHGPTITRYEVVPKSGVRVDRISALERDIARATRAQRINILAPIPGKDTVGIEIANASKVKVTLRELLETEDWLHSGAKLPLALGKDVYGKTIIADLSKMPHCLVAGTTGSGKSVCINSIIASLLFRYTPEELRFIMIDPKVVEMQIYNGLPHLVTPVVTDPKKVLLALRWVVDEMELRYQIFAKAGVRNVTSFNERPLPKSQKELDEVGSGKPEVESEKPAAGNEPAPAGSEEELPPSDLPLPTSSVSVRRDDEIIIPDRMPFIVVIVDELADLMQTAPADVEGAIARITQMARAAGIHLIVATQTPRADVVTGIIKANIPSRIAFQVASGLDSRVILDQKGAEKLLGQGDMLYLPPASSQLVRAQGVLVTDEEIRVLVEFVSAQAKPKFESSIHEKLNSDATPGEDVTDEDEELVQKVLDIMRQERRASTSLFQRRLRLGYTRAARIVDILEQRGIVGPRDGAKDREILVSLETLD